MKNHEEMRAVRGIRATKAGAVALVRLCLFAALSPVYVLLPGGTANAADSLTQTMRISKADLSTPEGRQALQARASAIAARLCREFRDTRTVAHRETYAACTRDAMATAMAQIDTAVAAAQGSATAKAATPSAEAAERVAGN